MSKVSTMTKRFETLFKQLKSYDNKDYESIMMNLELLKQKYFSSKFTKTDTVMYEHKSFKDLI